jgi:predicted nuclease of predicted toxin-antitoxin system
VRGNDQLAEADITQALRYAAETVRERIVLHTAQQDDRILVSADTDFGALLAASHESSPSVVLVRRVVGRRVEVLAGLLIANLPPVEEDLLAGSIVVIGDDSLRIRRLPIG